MAKIVIDAREYSSSTGRYVSNLIKQLEKIDDKNKYVILLKPADMNKCELTNPNFTKIATPYKEFTFAEQLGFAWQLYRLKADLVHFCMTQQPLLYLKKSTTTIHDLTTARFNNPDKNPKIFYIKQRVYRIVIWYAAYKSKKIIVPSNYVKDDLISYTKIRSSKVVVTYESADKIEEKPKPITNLVNKAFIMYIGRPTPHKNLWQLIVAFDALKGVYPKLCLVLAGKIDTNYNNTKKRVTTNGIRDVYFTGYVDEGELRWLYENCQAYVFPSLSEGFGLPGLEAMAHKAPVVSSNATCLPEIYGDAAIYFEPTDKFSIATAITKVLSDKKLQETLIKKGSLQASKYSWETMAKKTLELYNKIIN